MNTNDWDDWDDFEYELEDASPSRLCSHCGKMLGPNGQCPRCGNLLDTIDREYADDAKEVRKIYGDESGANAELDEYGMPVAPERRRDVDYLEMEELDDHELPASFYAVAIAVLLVFSLAAIALNNIGLACRGAGILLTLGGVIGLITGYVALRPKYGGLGATLWMPWQGLLSTFFPGSFDSAPDHKGILVGKWSLLALMVGIICLLLSGLLGVSEVQW